MTDYTIPINDDRPPVNAAIRQAIAKLTKVSLLDLIQPLPKSYAWEHVLYGDLGEHWGNEVVTIPSVPVLIPATTSSMCFMVGLKLLCS